MEHRPRKTGRPRLAMTEELIEARCLSKQRRNRQHREDDIVEPIMYFYFLVDFMLMRHELSDAGPLILY